MLQRLVTLISRLAISLADGEAAMRQAKSASDAAAQLLKQEKVEQEEDQQKEANVSNEIKELQEGEGGLCKVSLCCTCLCLCGSCMSWPGSRA